MSEPLPPFLPWIKLGKQISTLPGYPRRELRKLRYYKFTYILQHHKAIFLRLSAEGTTSLILSLRPSRFSKRHSNLSQSVIGVPKLSKCTLVAAVPLIERHGQDGLGSAGRPTGPDGGGVTSTWQRGLDSAARPGPAAVQPA
jgi:hypothetical protein